MDLRKLYNRNR